MPTRREFLKLSAIAALGAAAGCAKPDGNPTARPTEAEPTKAIPPTKKIDVTDTPNVPATNEAIRLNAERGKEADYPQNYSELKAEKMLSESEFLGQMKGYPNVGKEYAQVKALLSAGLSKEKVSLSDIAFEVSSFSWDTDKYSWIVIARNSKTGEVYVPRDAKTHTRNIDMSVYGYLKEYQAGGALPFTMEPLKLPEFSGPEYKVGFSRSKKGWLVASLDGGPQKAWYNFRHKETARWLGTSGETIVLKRGVVVEEGTYTASEKNQLENFARSLEQSLKNGSVFKVGETSRWGKGDSMSVEGANFMVCFYDARKGEVRKKVVVAVEMGTDSVVIPSSSKDTFVVATRPEIPFEIEEDDIGEVYEPYKKNLGDLMANRGNPGLRLSYIDGKKLFAWRAQAIVVDTEIYRQMLLTKYLPERISSYGAVVWADLSAKDVSKAAIDAWLDALFIKVGNSYPKIYLNGTGLTNYKIDYDFLRVTLSRVREISDVSKARLLTSVPNIEVRNSGSGIAQFGPSKGVSYVRISANDLDRGKYDLPSQAILTSQFVHEQAHSCQDRVANRGTGDQKTEDYELCTYAQQVVDLIFLGLPPTDPYVLLLKGLILSGNYVGG